MSNGKGDMVTLISPVGVAKFSNLDSTEVINGKDTGKYAISLVLDPSNAADATFLKQLDAAAAAGSKSAIAALGKGKGAGITVTSNVKADMRKNASGELEDSGKVILTFRSKFQPRVYGLDKSQLDVAAVRNGDKIRVEVVARPYAMPSTKKSGVTLYASSILLVEKGAGSGPNEGLYAGIDGTDGPSDEAAATGTDPGFKF